MKADIFQAMIALVKHTRTFTSRSDQDANATNGSMDQDSEILLLMEQIPAIVKGLNLVIWI